MEKTLDKTSDTEVNETAKRHTLRKRAFVTLIRDILRKKPSIFCVGTAICADQKNPSASATKRIGITIETFRRDYLPNLEKTFGRVISLDECANDVYRESLVIANSIHFRGRNPVVIDKLYIAHDSIFRDAKHSRATGWSGFSLRDFSSFTFPVGTPKQGQVIQFADVFAIWEKSVFGSASESRDYAAENGLSIIDPKLVGVVKTDRKGKTQSEKTSTAKKATREEIAARNAKEKAEREAVAERDKRNGIVS